MVDVWSSRDGVDASKAFDDAGVLDRPYASKKRAEETRPTLETLASALVHLRELVARQIDQADERDTPANTPNAGDNHVRMLINALLPARMQRTLFLDTMSDRRAWPRARALFGAPPYAFLRPNDAGVLRAAGIAPGRANLSYSDPSGYHVPNYTQFGTAHLVDASERQYRVAQDNDPDEAPVAIEALRVPPYDRQGRHILIVRIPKRSRTQRSDMMRNDIGRRALSFPRVGDVLRLTPSSTIVRLTSTAHDEELSVRVEAARMSAPTAATGLVAVRVVAG